MINKKIHILPKIFAYRNKIYYNYTDTQLYVVVMLDVN